MTVGSDRHKVIADERLSFGLPSLPQENETAVLRLALLDLGARPILGTVGAQRPKVFRESLILLFLRHMEIAWQIVEQITNWEKVYELLDGKNKPDAG